MDDAKHEWDDDPHDFTPPPAPTPREVRRRWAQEGNVESLLAEIRSKTWSCFSVDEQFKHLLRACQVRARTDPEEFSRTLFAEMVGFNGFLLLRTQVLVIDRVVGRGPFACKPTLGDLSADVAERLLPRLAEMQQAMAEVLVAQAQAVRLWGLAKAKAAQEGRRMEEDEPPRRGARAKAPEAREGGVPLPAGSRRRG